RRPRLRRARHAHAARRAGRVDRARGPVRGTGSCHPLPAGRCCLRDDAGPAMRRRHFGPRAGHFGPETRASVRLLGWHGPCVTVVRRRCRMLPSPLAPSAGLTVAELLGPLSALLLVSLLAALAVLVAWLVGEQLDRTAWRRAADVWTRVRPLGSAQTLDRALASRPCRRGQSASGSPSGSTRTFQSVASQARNAESRGPRESPT